MPRRSKKDRWKFLPYLTDNQLTTLAASIFFFIMVGIFGVWGGDEHEIGSCSMVTAVRVIPNKVCITAASCNGLDDGETCFESCHGDGSDCGLTVGTSSSSVESHPLDYFNWNFQALATTQTFLILGFLISLAVTLVQINQSWLTMLPLELTNRHIMYAWIQASFFIFVAQITYPGFDQANVLGFGYGHFFCFIGFMGGLVEVVLLYSAVKHKQYGLKPHKTSNASNTGSLLDDDSQAQADSSSSDYAQLADA